MYILSPSILSADFGHLRSELDAIKSAGAQYVHIDVMDGVFVRRFRAADQFRYAGDQEHQKGF